MGAAERGVGLVKTIMKKTEADGSDSEEAFAAFKNTRNSIGYSPNHFFLLLRNVRDLKLLQLAGEPYTEAMVRARDKTRADSVKKDDGPQLSAGDLVRGQDPKTKVWTMAGIVDSIVHNRRSVSIKFQKSGSRIFSREDVKPDTTDKFQYNEQEKKDLDNAKEKMVRHNTR